MAPWNAIGAFKKLALFLGADSDKDLCHVSEFVFRMAVCHPAA